MLTLFADWLALMADGARIMLTGTWRQRFLRARFVLLFAVVWPPLALFTGLTLALDHLLFPGFTKTEIKTPLFIVGNLRTGSTYLHKTLGQDTDGISTFRTIDLFMPSITAKKLAGLVGKLDGALGGFGKKLVVSVDGGALQGFRKIHDVRLFDPEEDDFVLLALLRSGAMWEIAPGVERYKRMFYMDELMDRAEQDRTWAFYKRMVQRQVYHQGADRLFVSKNPLQTHKLEGLLRTFPDARVINLVRIPLKTVPSVSSMWHFVWHESGARPHAEIDPDTVIAQCKSFYAAPGPTLEKLGKRGKVIRYEDLLLEPRDIIRGTFEAMGLPISPGLAEVLDRAQAKVGTYTSKHKYKGAAHGLTEERLTEAFAEVFERFGYDRPDDAVEQPTMEIA